MKRLITIMCGLLLFPLIEAPEGGNQVRAQSFSMGVRVGHASAFYAPLRPYGEWIEIEPGFYGWRPVRVRHGWRPYLHGRWAWTDYGWYWHSYEPFGWAVFHYGRWYYDDFYGWIWIPDTVWGPAWVEWRYNDDYIGWAPLPPYASFSISVGIRFTTRWYAPSHYWCFVRYRNFTSTRIDDHVADEGYSRRLIRTTRGAVRYEVDRDRVINRGVDRELIERRGNVRISRMDVGETRERNERIIREGGRERIEVYRPSRSELERGGEAVEARRPDRRISLDVGKIERERRGDDSRIDAERSYDRRTPDQRTPQRWQERRTPEERSPSPAPERRVTPERRDDRNEFRTVQPRQPAVREPATRQPERREGSATRSQPRRDESRSGGTTRNRGRDR